MVRLRRCSRASADSAFFTAKATGIANAALFQASQFPVTYVSNATGRAGPPTAPAEATPYQGAAATATLRDGGPGHGRRPAWLEVGRDDRTLMTESRLPSVSLMPGMLPNEELFLHWRKGIEPYFRSVPLADPRDPPQVPEVHLYNCDSFLFFDTNLSRQKFVRDGDWLRRNDDSDHVGLQLFLRGSNQVENGGRDFVIEPGGICAVNLGYEIDATCTDAEVLSIILPRDALAEHLPVLHDARGLLFDPASTPGRLLGDFMHSLRRTLPVAAASDAPLLSESLMGLLRVLLAGGDPISIEARRGVFTAVQQHIDAHLGDPDLGVETLCARFRVSRATLYRLFHDQGGVRAYILRRRLMACFKALTAPALTDLGIFEVALNCGFSSPSHLSSRFREHFGMTPSEVREAARHHHDRGEAPVRSSDEDGLADIELMQRWTVELGDRDRAGPEHAPG